ncbi:MAG: hypothetical protein KGH55_01280 [Nanoarchaeota archaeon]|nr:hypothetical protein [Nanoarchaeota archaeon]
MSRVKSIGFDGLNSSGKGTQIRLFGYFLEQGGIPSIILRGDGTRSGLGREDYDPRSEWWKSNYEFLLDKSDNPIEKLNLQYQRLAREYRIVRKRVEKSWGRSVIILDRSYVSRYFTLKQFIPQISMEASLKSYNPKNGEFIPPIIPDRTIILKVPKSSLIERLLKKEDLRSPRGKAVINIIEKNYDLFMEILLELEGRKDIVIIDGDRDEKDINNEIIRFYEHETKGTLP